MRPGITHCVQTNIFDAVTDGRRALVAGKHHDGLLAQAESDETPSSAKSLVFRQETLPLRGSGLRQDAQGDTPEDRRQCQAAQTPVRRRRSMDGMTHQC